MIHIADGDGSNQEDGPTDAESVVRPSSSGKDFVPAPVITLDSAMLQENAKSDEEVQSKGVYADEARDATTKPPPLGEGGLRSISTGTSSKFASLRATFEKNGPSNGFANRRVSSSESQNERSRELNQDLLRDVARLKDELEKERELREAYEEKCTVLEEEGEELREQLENGDVKWRSQYERERNHVDEKQSRALSLEVQRSRAQAGTLQRQISEMKRCISTSTRIDSEVTDSTFAQEMGILHHELQNWIVNNFRRANADLSPDELCARLEKVAEPQQMEILRPVYANFSAGLKLAIYQSTAMAYLIEVFDAPLLFGLPSDQEWQKRLRQASDSLPEVLQPVAYNKWRSTTLDLLRQSEHMGQWTEHAAAKMSELICIALSTLTNVEESDSRRTSLNGIVKHAVSVAHLMRVQRAKYEVRLPSPGSAFDVATTDAVSADAEASPSGQITCATFPSVVKLGDEQGDNVHVRNVVCKAKAICGEA